MPVGSRAELEAHAAAALATGSVLALVAMAFFAVPRRARDRVILGAGLYRGGISINLARFFRVTSVVLVIIAGGLLATVVHTAHEAAWFNSFQGQALNLSWLVVPGTITSSLLSGMLGVQPLPTYAEAGVWLIYVVGMLLFVVWPLSGYRGWPRIAPGLKVAAVGVDAEVDQFCVRKEPRDVRAARHLHLVL